MYELFNELVAFIRGYAPYAFAVVGLAAAVGSYLSTAFFEKSIYGSFTRLEIEELAEILRKRDDHVPLQELSARHQEIIAALLKAEAKASQEKALSNSFVAKLSKLAEYLTNYSPFDSLMRGIGR
jgi:hypothetical protein